ncbi:MAG TPA: hypothetical protein VFP92_05955 [Rhodanobacteraceae bacterium]|nr:hypothetical protein [Rhodanobacteraceae bacterium]
MKHLSLLLTVLILGAVPLTAAALDYGPNQPLLVAENGAPPLPGAQARAVSMGAMPDPGTAEADDHEVADAAPALPRVVATPSHAAAARPDHGPSASNRPHGRATGHPTAPSPASWQSLLPGSIQ